jgi:hypothetical protein
VVWFRFISLQNITSLPEGLEVGGRFVYREYTIKKIPQMKN